jgi:hypothetical protein
MTSSGAYFLRWRILARMRRFLRPSLRRPLPVFLVPKECSRGMWLIGVRLESLTF